MRSTCRKGQHRCAPPSRVCSAELSTACVCRAVHCLADFSFSVMQPALSAITYVHLHGACSWRPCCCPANTLVAGVRYKAHLGQHRDSETETAAPPYKRICMGTRGLFRRSSTLHGDMAHMLLRSLCYHRLHGAYVNSPSLCSRQGSHGVTFEPCLETLVHCCHCKDMPKICCGAEYSLALDTPQKACSACRDDRNVT